jgi:DNA transposition AAA+ family ATPase
MKLKGSSYSEEVRARLAAVPAPDYPQAVLEINRWMVRRGLPAAALAELAGLGRSTVNQWCQGLYPKFHQGTDVSLLTARLWEAMLAHPAPAPAGPPERFLATHNAEEIRRALTTCLRQHACAVVHGAPAEEKTFSVKCLVAEHQAAGRDDLLYVYAPADPSPLGMLQRICAAAGTALRSNLRFALIQSLIENFRQRERMPTLIVDEAQHLLRAPFDALETIRELRDLTGNDLAERRQDSYGCGLLLIGSHELYAQFERNKFLLGQWRDRIQIKRQLTGMDETEALEIAARELGNGRPARLGEELKREILRAAREVDPHTLACGKCRKALNAGEACSCGGQAKPCVFHSPRKLSIWIDRAREKRAAQRGAA